MIVLRNKNFVASKVFNPKVVSKQISEAVRLAGDPKNTRAWNVKLLHPQAKSSLFSDNREKVPDDILEKAKKDGVVQQDREGRWRIINRKKGVYWSSVFKSKESGQAALRAYWSNKH